MAGLVQLLGPVNEALIPALRTGIANPLPLTSGFVVLEVIGRRTGQTRSVPLLGTDWGSALIVSTVRAKSQWVKNLAAGPQASVWLRGRKRPVTAQVFQRGDRLDTGDGPEDACSRLARQMSALTGASFAVLRLR